MMGHMALFSFRSCRQRSYWQIIAFVTGTGLGYCSLAQSAAESGMERYPPGIELPEGRGLALLQDACTRCHDLRGLPAYKGYWNRMRWQSMVETMVKNGAVLTPSQVQDVTDYLNEHFGLDAE